MKRELDGLAVWFDRNGNGASDRGEVVPIEDLGVEALATRATGIAGDAARSPMNSAGLRRLVAVAEHEPEGD